MFFHQYCTWRYFINCYIPSTSTDDVDVLKQELGKSQLQLDSILLAGEKDVARLQETVDNLNNDKNK